MGFIKIDDYRLVLIIINIHQLSFILFKGIFKVIEKCKKCYYYFKNIFM